MHVVLIDIRKHINSLFSANIVAQLFDWFSWLAVPLAYL